MKGKDIASLIEHTLLKPTATYKDIRRLCEEALEASFFSVCVNPFFIRMAKEILGDSDVKVTTVIGFPLGMDLTESKVFEAMKAAVYGADEIDIVMNIGALKSSDWETVRRDISDTIVYTKQIAHKAIIETGYLTDDEKRKAVEIALEAGSEFIKTSTGFGPQGARVEDIRLIKSIVNGKAGIKAAGGIRTARQVFEMLEAGATRIGTSAGAEIMKEIKDS
ncbi:MAG: deoxyribose-phosphate aldolase [Nitrospirota bacterium]